MSQPISSSPLLHSLPSPSKKITTEEDVHLWKTTSGYRTFLAFLKETNEAVVGCDLPYTPNSTSSSSELGVQRVLRMIDELSGWIEGIPPLDTPQRFGNLAFRTWGSKLEENSSRIIAELYDKQPEECRDVIGQLEPYLITSFGSFGRMDYGTGHEVSFAMFLLCLSLLGFFSTPSSTPATSTLSTILPPETSRPLVLTVFPAYLKLCYKLQDVYRLEPAGSHGVWGLDDSSFLPYLWGSGELRDEKDFGPDVVLKKGLERSNLYFIGVERVRELKKGPFHEHSSQLHSIAIGVKTWKKVNEGMFKMYEAEVLSKRVVVQHLPLGGLIAWDPTAASSTTSHPTSRSTNFPPSSTTTAPTPAPHIPSATTGAPWASTTTTSPTSRVNQTPSSTGAGSDGPTVHAGSSTGAPWAATRAPTGMPPTSAPWARASTNASNDSEAGMPPTGAPWASSR